MLASCEPLPTRNLPAGLAARRALFGELVRQAACRYGLSPALLDALVIQESRYNQSAVSPKGAIGLGQLMPSTAKLLGVDAYSAVDNLDGAARYLKTQLHRFGSVKLALAAYNAGPGRVDQYGDVPPFAETKAYVAAISRNYSGDGVGPASEFPSGLAVRMAAQSDETKAAVAAPIPPKWDVFTRFAWQQAEARKGNVLLKEGMSDEE